MNIKVSNFTSLPALRFLGFCNVYYVYASVRAIHYIYMYNPQLYCYANTGNECAVNNGGCTQICTDTTASFECSCNTGYILESDGLSCGGIV